MFHPGDSVRVTMLEGDDALTPVEHRGLIVEAYEDGLLAVRVGERGKRLLLNTRSPYFVEAEVV